MSFRVGHVVYDPDPSCAWNDLSAEFELFCRQCSHECRLNHANLACRGSWGLASSERDERLVAWLSFSRRFLGAFLEAAAALDPDQAPFSPCRPLIVNSPGAKRKMPVVPPPT